MSEVGQEPDYRFTLANERTFLAWIRTSLALLAGGVALMQLVPSFGLIPGMNHGLSVLLVVAGGALAASAMRRWKQVQAAMRVEAELPPNRLPGWLGVTLLVIAVTLLLLIIVEPGVH